MIRFCRSLDEPGTHVIDIRAGAEQPYCRLSPDYQHGMIPIHCLTGMYSETVTGLMEGLKLIGKHGRPGHINVGYMVGPGRIRETQEGEWLRGYSYMGRSVGIAEARRRMMIPAYLWVLTHRVGNVVALLQREARHRTVGLYDALKSTDIESSEPLSTAALLTANLNGKLKALYEGDWSQDQ